MRDKNEMRVKIKAIVKTIDTLSREFTNKTGEPTKRLAQLIEGESQELIELLYEAVKETEPKYVGETE